MLWEWSLLHLSWAVPFRKAAHKCTCTGDGCSSVPGAECLWNTTSQPGGREDIPITTRERPGVFGLVRTSSYHHAGGIFPWVPAE